MLFNSYQFIFIFLPVTFIGFFTLARIGKTGTTYAAVWLGLASIVFYSIWSVQYLPLLLSSIIFNYFSGRWINRFRDSALQLARIGLSISIIANLLLLGYYKYSNFFIDSANTWLGTGINWNEIILPIGISFFTFTQIAFLVDVYKGKAGSSQVKSSHQSIGFPTTCFLSLIFRI